VEQAVVAALVVEPSRQRGPQQVQARAKEKHLQLVGNTRNAPSNQSRKCLDLAHNACTSLSQSDP
jgi:hypothetical protein